MEQIKNFYNKNKGIIISGFLGLFLGIILTVAVNNRNVESADIEVEAGGQKVKISLKGRSEIRYDSLLNQMFNDSFMKASILSWLTKKDVYSLSDPSLEKRLCKLEYQEDLSECIRRIQSNKIGPFSYKGEKLFFEKVGNSNIASGQAHVCMNSIYANKNVSLSIKGNRVEVLCMPKFECLDNNNVKIQIRKSDVKILFRKLSDNQCKDSVWIRKI
jgi:hypothetical protein